MISVDGCHGYGVLMCVCTDLCMFVLYIFIGLWKLWSGLLRWQLD